MQPHSHIFTQISIHCYSCSDLGLVEESLAVSRTILAGLPTKVHRNQVYFWNKSVDQHQVYEVINLKLLACYYCKNGGDYGYCSEADAYYNPPHPARHIGIKAC